MAPLLTNLDAVSSISLNYVGGNVPALSRNSLFSFGAVLFAAMQGTLAMESTPSRISYQKWNFLLALEVLEVIAVILSEVSSSIELRNAVNTRLEWLQWLPWSNFCKMLI